MYICTCMYVSVNPLPAINGIYLQGWEFQIQTHTMHYANESYCTNPTLYSGFVYKKFPHIYIFSRKYEYLTRK